MIKLKKLSDLATPGGPIYHRFIIAIDDWIKVYKKRNNTGDIYVIKFLEHFREINEIENKTGEIKDET